MTLTKTTTLRLASVLAFSFIAFTALGNHAHAASFTVNTDTHPSTCTLDEAIGNINDQANTNTDCVPTGAYGTNDTVTIPEGTVLLTAGLPAITESITITGAGMGESVVDGADGTHIGLHFDGTGSEQFALSALTMKNTRDYGVNIEDADVSVDGVEVYGSSDVIGSVTNMGSGIVVSHNSGDSMTANLSNVHIHHLKTSEQTLVGISLNGSGVDGITNATLENVTVNDLSSTTANIVAGIAPALFNAVAHTMNVNITNATVANINNTSTVFGIGSTATPGGVAVVNVSNSTISHIRGSVGPFGSVGGLAAAGASSGALTTVNAQNVVVSDVLQDGDRADCLKSDITSSFGGTGVPTLNITSSGGNLSDDNSCKSYFTKSTDQNNVSALADTLEPLSDNGGFIPTMALKKNSPAIDSGVTVPSLTTDARLAVRPQGNAFDSGAYESPYTKAATNTSTDSLAGTGENIHTLIIIGSLTLLTGALLLTRRLHASKL